MTKNCEKYKGLMMGLMDNELSEEEASEVNSHLTRCAACREEYRQLQKTTAALKDISYAEPHDEVLDRVWKSPYSRFTRNFGLFMVLGGWIVLVAYAIYEALSSSREALLPKTAMAVVIVGFVILLVSVIWGRIKTYKSDPYKEVQR
jgi:anti-sigma factor RsiW